MALLFYVSLIYPFTTTFAATPEIPLKDGAWNITLQINPPTPDFLPIVQMLCLSQKDPVPIPSKNAGCRLLTKEIEGNTVFWVAECREKEFVTRSVGNATYDMQQGRRSSTDHDLRSRKSNRDAHLHSDRKTTGKLSLRLIAACQERNPTQGR